LSDGAHRGTPAIARLLVQIVVQFLAFFGFTISLMIAAHAFCAFDFLLPKSQPILSRLTPNVR